MSSQLKANQKRKKIMVGEKWRKRNTKNIKNSLGKNNL